MMESPSPDQSGAPHPSRAFTQGVGLVFQTAGVVLFILMMSICCGTSLLSKESAQKTDLTRIGWHLQGDPTDAPTYSAQKALTICLFCGVFFGLALAAIGLGLQAESSRAPWMAVTIAAIGAAFWIVHAVMAAMLGSIFFAMVAGTMGAAFAIFLLLALAALRELRHRISDKQS
jgi:hypothetical protein